MKSLAEIRDQILIDLYTYKNRTDVFPKELQRMFDDSIEELDKNLHILKGHIVNSIKDEFYPDGDDDDGVQCLIEGIERTFDNILKVDKDRGLYPKEHARRCNRPAGMFATSEFLPSKYERKGNKS